MKIYAYTDTKDVVCIFDVASEAYQQRYLESILNNTLREDVSEDLFNDGHRKESAKISFCFAVLSGQKKSPTSEDAGLIRNEDEVPPAKA